MIMHEEKEVIRAHRVGTITLGVSLIFFGILFMIKEGFS